MKARMTYLSLAGNRIPVKDRREFLTCSAFAASVSIQSAIGFPLRRCPHRPLKELAPLQLLAALATVTKLKFSSASFAQPPTGLETDRYRLSEGTKAGITNSHTCCNSGQDPETLDIHLDQTHRRCARRLSNYVANFWPGRERMN